MNIANMRHDEIWVDPHLLGATYSHLLGGFAIFEKGRRDRQFLSKYMSWARSSVPHAPNKGHTNSLPTTTHIYAIENAGHLQGETQTPAKHRESPYREGGGIEPRAMRIIVHGSGAVAPLPYLSMVV